MPVLTEKELKQMKRQGTIATSKKAKQKLSTNEYGTVKRSIKRQVGRFRFPPAPIQGRCTAGVIIDGKEIQLTLNDQIYEVPKQAGPAYLDKIRRQLLEQGFEEVSIFEDTGEFVEKQVLIKKNIWRLGHPDNTEMEKIEGNCAVTIDGEELQFKIERGIVTVHSFTEYKAFLNIGWHEISDGPEVID